ncbi:ATP-binding protein [Streptomyces sp. NPDC051567]|uniref:ATP-binding protein n=1 Tax=Streptomyces sp. NPDC051567 TaxID=3365660 RepID=UPI00379C4A5C
MAVVDAQRVGHVRRIVAARLRYLGLAVLLDPVLLVVSELVTNAVEHTAAPGGSVTVTQVFARGELHLLVQDDGRGLPRVQAAGPEAESGRGLYLVDCVTAELGGRWGHSLGTGTVWCVIPVPRAGP